ncbi:MAG: hypothetical protein KA171_14715 [Reyranella sp.]|nr:hypothetical protein [Reyranella sp.]
MDVAGLFEQPVAMATGFVDLLDRVFDAVDGVQGEIRGQSGMLAACKLGDSIESGANIVGPAVGFVVVDETSRSGGDIDRPTQLLFETLDVAGGRGGGGDIELAEQGRVSLGEFDDHLDQGIDALLLQMGPDAVENGWPLLAVVGYIVGGEAGRHHVLAEAPIAEGRARAFAADLLAAFRQNGAVIFRASDLGEHSVPFDRQKVDLPVAMVFLAPREHFGAGLFAQDGDVEAGLGRTLRHRRCFRQILR